jgi:hypothetical protein
VNFSESLGVALKESHTRMCRGRGVAWPAACMLGFVVC